MSIEISCPSCAESEDLTGQRIGDELSTGIQITCGVCGTEWVRDTAERCERCDSDDMYAAPVAVIEKSRGSQLSIVSTSKQYFCWTCDRDLIDDQRRSGTALMPDELPTETDR